MLSDVYHWCKSCCDLSASKTPLDKAVTLCAIAFLVETIFLIGFLLASYHISQIWSLSTLGIWGGTFIVTVALSKYRDYKESKNPPTSVILQNPLVPITRQSDTPNTNTNSP